MLRYIAALVLLLAPSLAAADNLDSSRDANLAPKAIYCLLVVILPRDSTVAAASNDVESAILEESRRVALPLTSMCSGRAYQHSPALLMSFRTLDTAFSYSLQVVLPSATWAPFKDQAPDTYTLPAVWEESGVVARASGITPKDIKDQAVSVFDSFMLTWKKQHQQ